jgi:hypothetical protein
MSVLNLDLTDAPIDTATKVWIQFTGVELKPLNGDSITESFTPERGFDLLTLQNGKTATMLNGAVIPPGQYEWVRLMVDTTPGNLYIVDETGQHNLTIPSGAETGLKLTRGFTMPVGGTADFTVDFILSKSIIAPPGQSSYFLKPVLRIEDNSQVGTISGEFQSATLAAQSNCGMHSPVVYLYPGAGVTPDDVYNPISGTTDTETDMSSVEPLTTATASLNAVSLYAYRIAFVPAGTYTVAFTCDNDDPSIDESAQTQDPIHFSVYTQSVMVAANQATVVNF